MPETPERKVKKKVVSILDEFGAYYLPSDGWLWSQWGARHYRVL